ncbi:hypothetical protein NL676_029733 [Syzygium grande]|nr:hypothetical protein NL676_029733 [Syzygium grande]
MKVLYDVDPDVKHYGCMVDILGRAGRIQEATELIRTMPLEADAAVWGALLSACRTHGNVEIGEWAAQSLENLQPTHGPCRVLLSNIYADVGRWHDAFSARRVIHSQGLKRLPGCSGVGQVFLGIVGLQMGEASQRRPKAWPPHPPVEQTRRPTTAGQGGAKPDVQPPPPASHGSRSILLEFHEVQRGVQCWTVELEATSFEDKATFGPSAKILSKFVTVENGASHAISAYLQRASTAFDELAHLHKELKAPKSERKSKHHKLDSAEEPPQETGPSVEPRQTVTVELSEEPSHGDHEGLGGNRKKQKKSKKKKVDVDHTGNLGENEGNLIDRASKGDSHLASEVLDKVSGKPSNGAEKNAGVVGEKKKNKKHQQNWKDEKGNLVENGMEAGVRNEGRVMAVDEAKKKVGESNEGEEKGGEDFSEQSTKKNKKKKGGNDSSLLDNGVVVKERESSKKKRGHEEIQEGREEDGLMERPNKKSKKRKDSDEH